MWGWLTGVLVGLLLGFGGYSTGVLRGLFACFQGVASERVAGAATGGAATDAVTKLAAMVDLGAIVILLLVGALTWASLARLPISTGVPLRLRGAPEITPAEAAAHQATLAVGTSMGNLALVRGGCDSP